MTNAPQGRFTRHHAWDRLDCTLLRQELAAIADDMKAKLDSELASIRLQPSVGGSAAFYPYERVRLEERLADEWAGRQYQACLRVWELLGHETCRAFYQAVYHKILAPCFGDRKGQVAADLFIEDRETGQSGRSNAAIYEFGRAMNRMSIRWKAKLEGHSRGDKSSERLAVRKVESREQSNALLEKATWTENCVASQTTTIEPVTLSPKFSISDDYRSVKFQGDEYTLTRAQSEMMKILFKAHKSGHPAVGKDCLLAAVESTSSVRDTWRGCKLWRTLVVSQKKGTYRLEIPDS